MADEEPGRELPQRVRGAARTGPSPPAPSSSPVLSEELRQRMRAAVTAERSGAATKQDEAPGGEATSPEPARPVRPRAANAGPIAEDEITEWLGTSRQAAVLSQAAVLGQAADLRSSRHPRSSRRPRSSPRSPPCPSPRSASPRSGPGGFRRPAARSRRVARFVAVVLVIGVLAVAAVRYFGRSPAASPTSAAAAHQAAAGSCAAATWVAQQVSRDVKVSCDPAMCAALRARGFPSRELLVLGSISEVPTSSAVVVETPAVLSLFGSSLATAWAPAVLASFGSGPSLVTVRVIARTGPPRTRPSSAPTWPTGRPPAPRCWTTRRSRCPPLASGQLTAGAVDSRLLEALAFVAGHQPISIVQFGNPGPGASADVPLRYVDLAERDRARHLSSAAYVRSLRAYLSTADVRFRPAIMTTVVLPDGQPVLRVEVTAPSPLGVFGTQSSP